MSEVVLEGLKGVDHVTSFYADGFEKNAVWYHPSQITISEMQQALKEAGAYLGTERIDE